MAVWQKTNLSIANCDILIGEDFWFSLLKTAHTRVYTHHNWKTLGECDHTIPREDYIFTSLPCNIFNLAHVVTVTSQWQHTNHDNKLSYTNHCVSSIKTCEASVPCMSGQLDSAFSFSSFILLYTGVSRASLERIVLMWFGP